MRRAFKFRFYPSEVQAAEYTRSAFRWRDGVLTLAKMAEPLDIRWSRPLPEGATPSTVTVSRDSAGHWFVSLLCEDPSVTPLPATDAVVGIDVGLDHLLVLSTGEKIGNHRLARAINDASWRQFRQQLEYKASWHGRDVIAIDRWFPSSKLCSACGALAAAMPLRVRTWTCGCGAIHDRDVNAARNILAAGLAVTVCGAGARPQRNPPGGQSATKQKTPRREP